MRPLAFLLAAAVVACNHDHDDALAAVAAIDASCRDAKPEDARAKMLETVEKNPLFRRAFESATAGATDLKNVNACGLVLVEIKSRLGKK